VRSGDPAVTVSFGLSCYRPGDDIHTLRERADRALYRAKQSGRDRIVRDESCPGSD
jgi:PleD family two-component response regulator